MPYKTICQIYDCFTGSNQAGEFTNASITPNGDERRFMDILGRKEYERGLITPYWLYLYRGGELEEEAVFKGVIQSIYDTWGIMRFTHYNDLQKYDFLYAFDHREQLLPDSVGILYELT